ncbi:glycosyltransferase family 25 protein [Acinetobacter bereziniae]|uniref:glycosyltransferase family 25 protein n=1 Tax=Acinetobacter bereziniae TaxID=106648 RepID=UPI001116120A|nr:glycosyltransferase family 25 protein [Acinetobacter bereziniae]TNL53972.1 glycosyltransferase family 25 protein [Acinetobacter bereziniae]TNL63066.1 glycosyltransferase family 25 protein [Acinetobacter bereziniae]
MKSFVISLTSAEDRRAHIQEQFGNKDIPFSFFDAIEPMQLDHQAQKIGLAIQQNNLSKNELACLYSHISLWKKAVDEKMQAIAIFEDDIYLSAGAELFLKDSNWLTVDIVKVEKSYNHVILDLEKIRVFKNQDFVIRKLKKAHLGAAGYILSYKGAVELLDYMHKQAFFDHVDQLIFRKYVSDGALAIYQLNPTLCIQDYLLNPNNQKFKTSLQWRDQVIIKPTGLQKIFREISRIFIQLMAIPFKTKLIFTKSSKE